MVILKLIISVTHWVGLNPSVSAIFRQEFIIFLTLGTIVTRIIAEPLRLIILHPILASLVYK